MDADEIQRKFQATIDEALAGAGAKLDAEVGTIVSQLVLGAARQIAELEEWQQEDDVEVGVAAYRKLAEKMVAAARRLAMFPEVDRHAWELALIQLGPNPPFYF